jgi:hypothetical protein
MDHEPRSTQPANVHSAHHVNDARVGEAIRAAAFVPSPTPLQALDAQHRFMSAIASERARDRLAFRRAR